MKRIFITLTTALVIGFTMSSCVDQIPEINEELILGRCLTPTEATAPIDRTDGTTVAFTWAESKGASQYTIEIYVGDEDADPETVFAGTPIETKVAKKSPLNITLASDKFYYARVKAQSSDPDIQDSKWKSFPYPIGTYEVKTNLWPNVAERKASEITVSWTEVDAYRVDHIRVSPSPDDDKAYKKYDVPASEGETVQMTVDGLNPSVKYTIAIHYKSANRGEVIVWTRPSLENPTIVSTSEQLNNALMDGAPVIQVAYSDTPYDLRVADAAGEMKNVVLGIGETKSIHIYGNATADGKMPVLEGSIEIPNGLENIRIESLAFDGASYRYSHMVKVPDPVQVEVEGKLVDETPISINYISVINCSATGYKAGFFLSDKANRNIGKITINSIYVTDVLGNGGNGFDIRQAIEVGAIEITESTFSQGFRTFFRIDKATVSSLIFKNNTLNNLCFVEDSNNKGIFYIGSGKGSVVIPEFVFENNLLLNMNGNATRTLFSSDEIGVPNKIANNYFYKLGAGFWMPETDSNGEKVNAEGKGKLTQTAGLAGGGQILSSDPCYDSAENNLYIKNAAVLEAKVGDPRWLQAYKEPAEDLTLTPVTAGKSWNLMDAKTFGKTVKKSMVRDGLRFIVGANQFKVAEKGLEFAAAGTVEALGTPSDAAIAFMVNTPGTVILSAIKSNTGSAQGHVTVAYGPAEGSKATIAGAANIGVKKSKVVLPNIAAGDLVYIYGCTPFILEALQWTDQVDAGSSATLSAPVVTASHASVDDTFTGEVKLSWDAVAAAGSYKIYKDVPADAEELPEAFAEVSGTEYALPLSKLGTGKFSFKVQACPAAEDMSREASELSDAVAFTYLETLKPVAVETVWSNDEFKSIYDELGSGDINSSTNGYSETAMTLSNLRYVFGGGKFKFGQNANLAGENVYRCQLGGAGSTTKAALQFMPSGPGTLYVEFVASGTSDANARGIAVSINETKFGEDKIAPVVDDKAVVTSATFDMTSETFAPGTVISVYSIKGGINIFTIKWIPSTQPSVDPTWVSETTVWGDAYFSSIMNDLYPGTAEIKEDFTAEKITYIAGGGKFKPGTTSGATRIQLGGSGNTTKQCLSFTVSGPGTLSIKALSTGDDDRVLVIHDGTSELGTISAPNKSATPTSIPLELNTKSGDTLYVYSRSSGVNILEIAWTVK